MNPWIWTWTVLGMALLVCAGALLERGDWFAWPCLVLGVINFVWMIPANRAIEGRAAPATEKDGGGDA